MVKWYPPSSQEWEIIVMGIRIDRFVSPLECRECSLDTKDHTVGNLFWHWIPAYECGGPIKICLKDYYRVKKGGE